MQSLVFLRYVFPKLLKKNLGKRRVKACIHVVASISSTVLNLFATLSQTILMHMNTSLAKMQALEALLSMFSLPLLHTSIERTVP